MSELRDRLRRAEGRDDASGASQSARLGSASGQTKPAIRVEDLHDDSGPARSARDGERGAFERAGVRHLRASAEGRPATVEVWVDPKVRLSKEARAALRGFETE